MADFSSSKKGPFASSVGVGRAEPEWAALNKVTSICGHDGFFEAGEKSDGPLPVEHLFASADDLTGLKAANGEDFDLLIVGAGLSGAVIAERCSKELGMTSLIIDKRDHIGGNCYDYVSKEGIRCSKYGAHLFHTKFERVWDYVQKFSEWIPFDHRVKGRILDKSGIKQLVPIPPTRETVNTLFGENIQTDEEMEIWYEKNRIMPKGGGDPSNGEEAALSRVGPDLYEAVFKHYTKKQWDKYPAELDASVLLRLPCRTTSDDRYFSDDWQALPKRGYTRIFENMLLKDKNIAIQLKTDFFELKRTNKLPKHKLIVFTGQIDSYYSSLGMPKLEYRSLIFEESFVEEPEDDFFQEAMVVNYPSPDVPFTRIVEYKHTPNQPSVMPRGTIIAKEYSSDTGEPYYPVPNPENRALYEKYAELAAKEEGVCFVGRLASYKYFNMDQAILNALEMFDNLKETGKLEPKRKPEDFGPGDGPK